MGGDDDIDLTFAEELQDFSLFGTGLKSTQTLNNNGVTLEPRGECQVVLLGQDGGGDQNGSLLVIQGRLEGRPDGHLCLAIAYISANQPVRGLGLLHILHYPLDGLPLIRGFLIFEGCLKFLDVGIAGGKGEPLKGLTGGIDLQEFSGRLLGRPLYSLGGPAPGLSPQPIERGPPLPGADIFVDQIEPIHRDVELIFPLVLQEEIIVFYSLTGQRATSGFQSHQPSIEPYPVVDVDYMITPSEILKGGKGRRLGPLAMTDPSLEAENLLLSNHRQPLGGEAEAGLEIPYHNCQAAAIFQGMGREGVRYGRLQPEILQELLHPPPLSRSLRGDIHRPLPLQPPLNLLRQDLQPRCPDLPGEIRVGGGVQRDPGWAGIIGRREPQAPYLYPRPLSDYGRNGIWRKIVILLTKLF